jgi:hypothetical protein
MRESIDLSRNACEPKDPQKRFRGNYALTLPSGCEVLLDVSIGRVSQFAILSVIEALMANATTRNWTLNKDYSLEYYRDIIKKGYSLTEGENKAFLVWHSLFHDAQGGLN